MHVFVDESERTGIYLLGTALVMNPDELGRIRTELRDLRRPGQRRFHFSKESDARRRELLSALISTGIRARVYSCPAATREARAACLNALVADIVPAGARRLVLESRESMNRLDTQVVSSALRKYGEGQLQYLHLRPQEEPVLWVADAVAWAVGAGGDWRRRVAPMLDDHVRLKA
jgi:hypothetical protein